MSHLSRRSLVTSAAALPALAVPAAAIAAVPGPDPTFAAIAAHRDAYLSRMRAAVPTMELEPGDERETELDAALDAAYEVQHQAEWELSEVVPTSMAGVIAMLRYLEDWQEQAICLPEDPANWHSGGQSNDETASIWTYEADDRFDKFSGKPLKLPFTYWVMKNIRQALESLSTVQS